MLAQAFDLSNYAFNPYAIPTFLTGAAILLLGLLALIRERGSIVSTLFFLVTLTVAVWLLGISLVYCTTAERVAVWWLKATHLGVIFIPPAVYHFTVAVLRIYPEYKKVVWLSWTASALFFAAMAGSNAFIGGVNRYWWGFYSDYRWLSVPFLVFFFGLMLASLWLFWTEYRKALPGSHKLRTKSLLLAFTVGYVGSFDYLAAYGVPLYPFGYLPILGFIGMTARAMYRYRLVDITPTFAANEIIKAMADALLVLDRDGMVRVANPAACQLFGRPEKELIGSPLAALTRAISTPDRLHELILSGSIRDSEVVTGRADGITWLSVSSFLMRDEAQEPVAVVVIVRDITQRRRAEEQVRRHRERQAALHEINLAITSTLDLQSVLDLLVEKIDRLLPYGTAIAVTLVSPRARALEVAASRNLDVQEWRGDRWRSGRNLAQLVFESKAPLLVRNVQTNPGIENPEFYRRYGLVSYLGVPLSAKDEVLGVLSFYTTTEHPFTQEEVEFLSTLAGQAAIAIYNSRLYEQTRRQATEWQRTRQRDGSI